MTDLVSIIVPVYNCEQYIRKNVESLVRQSYRNIEIVFVDDGSTDQSAAILREYAQGDSRIKIIHQDNHGVSFARNTGLKAAEGSYITFADSDDYVNEGYVQLLLEGIRKADADISCCGFVLHRPDKEISFFEKEQAQAWDRTEALERLITGNLLEPGVWAKMFRADVLRDVRFDTSIKYNEDFLFDMEAFHNSEKVAFVGGACYHYILHENSATTNAPVLKRARDMMAVAEAAVRIPFEDSVMTLLLRRKNIGYLDNYNSLLYSSDGAAEKLKREIRAKILAERPYYRSIRMTKRELFFYYGITLCPGIYAHVFRGLKRILPDRRTFRI